MQHCSTGALRRLYGIAVASVRARVKEQLLWGRQANNATRMFSRAAEGHGRKTATVGKINKASPIGAVSFRLLLVMSSCAVCPVSLQRTNVFSVYLRSEASRAMHSSVFCSGF